MADGSRSKHFAIKLVPTCAYLMWAVATFYSKNPFSYLIWPTFMIISNIFKRYCFWALLMALGFSLSGCSKQDTPAAPAAVTAIAPAQMYDAVAKDGKGFTAGALMSAQTVYVLFDAQCPHCGALWNASLPLQKKVKFVWIPVSLMNPNSTLQGAALLNAANPVELMAAHEAALLAGNGGMMTDANPSAEAQASVKSNTLLFNSLGATSVPYMVAKNARTGAVVTNAGALQTPALATFLGVE